MISAIVYHSATGSCEHYAKELSRKLAVPCYPLSSARLRSDAEVIFVSWLLAGGVAAYAKAAKKLNIAAVAAVGMSPVTPGSADKVRSASKIPAETAVFCLQGGFHLDKLPLPMRLIMRWKTRDIAKKLDELRQKKGGLSPAEEATYTMAIRGEGEPVDWNVDEIVTWVLSAFDDEKILRKK